MTPTSLSTYSALQAKCDTSGTKLVLPEAMIHQRFMLIGEALGETEHDTERYFVGKVSWILWKLTGDVGLLRDVIHVTNVVKVRPPDNKLPRLQELGLSIDDFIPYLEEEISIVKPDAILAVGSLAARTLCPQVDSVLKHRGTIHTYTDTNGRSIPVIITLHPSYLQRGNMQLYPFVRNDVKIFANTGFGITAPTTTSFTTHLNPTFNQAYEFLSAVNQAPSTSYDIETVGRQKITCIGYTLTPDEAMCIPFRIQGLANRWSEAEQILLIRKMQDIHQNPNIVKIGQNVSYDNHYLLPLLGFPREPLIDTMYAHWLLHPDAPHDLGFIMSLYTDMPYHKDDAKNWELKSIPHTEALWQYNATDCIGTHRCWLGLASDLKDLGMYEFFVGYIMPVRRVLFEMEARGLRVNTDLMAEWREFVETDELPCWLERVNKYFPGRTVNPNSSKQLGEALTELYKLPIRRTAKGNFTLDNDRIVELKVQFPAYRNMLDDIHCARTIKSKDLGTYLDPQKLSPDGRMRTSFGTTITGRQSSKANAKGEGQNLQNQPKKFRVMFLPEPGHTFLEPDLVGAEAFVMVCMMKLDDIKQRMLNGEKIHNMVGEWIYAKPKEKLTPEEYLQAKRCVHGCVDGKTEVLTPSGWQRIDALPHTIAQWDATTHNITFTEAKNLTPLHYQGQMYHFTQGFFDQLVTPIHRMPHWQVTKGRERKPVTGPIKDILAKDFTNRRNSFKLPLSGCYSTELETLTEDEICLLAAIQADLSIRPHGELEGHFTKAYKIKRLRYLLNKLNLKYTEYHLGSFYIPRQAVTLKICSCLGPEKTFILNKLLANKQQVLVRFLHQLSFWDGRINCKGSAYDCEVTPTSWQYYTTNKQNAEVAAIVAHLTKHRASIRSRENNGLGSFGGKKAKVLYTVNISNHPLGDLTCMKTKIVSYNDYVYCPTVPTGYFLIRRNGCVSVTGNSNYRLGINKFAILIERPVAFAKILRSKYNAIMPQLSAYHSEIERRIRDERRIVTPYGRVRTFTGLPDDETYRSGYAQIPQSTVVDTLNMGMLGLWLIKPDNIYLALQVHDSILISLPPQLVEWFMPYIKAHMETLRKLDIEGVELTIPVDIGGKKDNWYGEEST